MQNLLVWETSAMQGWLNSDGYFYLSIVRRQGLAAVSLLQIFKKSFFNHVCDEMIFRICTYEIILQQKGV